MMQRLASAGLVVIAILAPVAAGLTMRESPVQVAPRASNSGVDSAGLDDPSSELIRLASDRTPFRLWHRIPSVRFGMVPVTPPSVPPVVVRPHPMLTGLLWGARPSVLLEGVPGHDGALVMSAGDTAGGLRVMEVWRDRVRLTGMDTSWILTMRQPWP